MLGLLASLSFIEVSLVHVIGVLFKLRMVSLDRRIDILRKASDGVSSSFPYS